VDWRNFSEANSHLVKKFPAFYGTRRFVTIYIVVFLVMMLCNRIINTSGSRTMVPPSSPCR